MKTSYIGVGSGVVDAPFSSTSFYLDADYKWLKLKVSFSKKGWYSLFVWDSAGKLRVQSLYINEPKEIILSENPDETSYSSISGVILQGEWKLEVLAATYKAQAEYKFTFECGFEVVPTSEIEGCDTWTDGLSGLTLNQFDYSRAMKAGKSWYKGDFHTHTTESDGKMTPFEGMDQAKKMGLDYFAVTDHNILPTKWVSDKIMTIPGIEITSNKGHFNALGLKEWVDWRPTCEDGGMESEDGMNRILAEVKSAGALVSINHPMLKPWEWQFRNTPLELVDVIEVWNDPTYKDNPAATEEALMLWDILWKDGHRIYGIGGSDSHLRPDESYEKNGPPSVIGDPATYVLAEELSAKSILGGVSKGHVYVSRGPVLDCQVMTDGKFYYPGDGIETDLSRENIVLEYEIHYKNICDNACLHWILNGEEVKKVELQKNSTLIEKFQWQQSELNWLRFEIRKNNGELLALTNPVHNGQKQITIKTWGELLSAAADKIRD